MELREEKKHSTNLNLYILRLLNRLYYLMSCADNKKQKIIWHELKYIESDLEIEKKCFKALVGEFNRESILKHYELLAVLNYERSLSILLDDLLKEITPKDNIFKTIFKRINTYADMLENKNFNLDALKDLTNFLGIISNNFNDNTKELLKGEVNNLFVETLRVIGIERLDELIDYTNPYFYPSLIMYAESYILSFKSEEGLHQEILSKKEELDSVSYLKELFINAYKMHMLSHETLILSSR